MLKSADHLKTLYRWWYNTIRSGFDSYDRTFHEPRLIYWIKYMKSSTFESVQRNEPNHVIIEFPERTSDYPEPKISKNPCSRCTEALHYIALWDSILTCILSSSGLEQSITSVRCSRTCRSRPKLGKSSIYRGFRVSSTQARINL